MEFTDIEQELKEKKTYWKTEPILLPFSGTPGSGQTSPARPLWLTWGKKKKKEENPVSGMFAVKKNYNCSLQHIYTHTHTVYIYTDKIYIYVILSKFSDINNNFLVWTNS